MRISSDEGNDIERFENLGSILQMNSNFEEDLCIINLKGEMY